MKKSTLPVAALAAVALVTVAAGCDKAERAGASAPAKTPTRIVKEIDIAPGALETVSFSAPAVPGTLSGKWRSSGQGGNDTLSGFTLTDPSDVVLESSFKGSSSGSFTVKVSAEGTHTFLFENAGQKQMPRHVTLDAEFVPD
jgi:hypothetical protein